MCHDAVQSVVVGVLQYQWSDARLYQYRPFAVNRHTIVVHGTGTEAGENYGWYGILNYVNEI